MSTEEKKLDLKQIGGGAGAAVLTLFLMQDRGVNLMNDKYKAETQVVLEKTVANADRINKLEATVAMLSSKIDEGFLRMREEIRSEVRRVNDTIQITMVDRWTREDHKEYAKQLNDRIERMERDIQLLKNKSTK